VSRITEYFIRRVSIEGMSMSPTYLPGERLTALRRWRPIRLGDVVVVRDPRDSSLWIVKRCIAKSGSQLDLRGDNADASTDSREFGLVASSAIAYIALDPRPRFEVS
jgi:nickel-type superoxide dismutase maturation protease